MASYEKAQNGTWSVRFYVTENFEVKQKRLRGFSTKKDAEKAYIDYQNQSIEDANNKISYDATRLKFSALYDEYSNFKKNQVKESTYYDFVRKSEKHILPYFSDHLVIQISPKYLLNWQQGLEKYKYKYKSGLRTYLYGILKYAERYYKIPNQLRFVDSFKNREAIREMQIWSEEEFNRFISVCDNLKYKAFFTALFLTGCRKGELIASTWKDWDIKNKRLNITKTLSKKVIGKAYVITPPKNNSSYRKITLPNNLVAVMLEYKNSLSEFNDDDFAFGGKTPMASTTVERYYESKCKEAKVRRIRIHDFRHSHASYLIGHGVSIVAVAKRLGHKDIEQTLNTYSHLIKEENIDIINKLEAISIVDIK